jgi:NAD(P)-dependent dehydrogenase (short-subunit alcohol dehydrogenase family)
LARDGWTLAVTNEPGRDSEGGLPAGTWHRVCDVSDPVAVASTYKDMSSQVGGVAVVSYNAGVTGPYEEQTATVDDWMKTLQVNLLGAVWVAKAVLPDMQARGTGAFILTASTNAHNPAGYMIPYRVSKAALVMYMRSLALLAAPSGVRVNAVCPGIVLTPMQIALNRERALSSGQSAEEALENRRLRIPNQRFVTEEEIAEVVSLLAGDRVPSIIGQEIVIDGGDVQFL